MDNKIASEMTVGELVNETLNKNEVTGDIKHISTNPQPEKRKRKYNDWKGKYFTAHGWNLIMFVSLIFITALFFWTLKGNHTLQMELYQITQEG